MASAKFSAEQLGRALQNGLAPLYLIFGEAILLAEEASDSIRAVARASGISERQTMVVDSSFRWPELFATLQSMSLFGDRKLVELRIPSGKPGKEGGEALGQLAEMASALTDVCVVSLPALDWQAQKSTWFVRLSESASVVVCNNPSRQQMPNWIRNRLQQQKQDAQPAALEFIVEHVEGNLLAAHQEILKLALLFPEGTLTLEDIRQSVMNVARYDLDQLRDALVAGDATRYSRLLEGLAGEGAAEPLVLWTLANEIRTLTLLREGLDRGEPAATLFKQHRVFDTQRKQALNAALRRLNSRRLVTSLQHAARIDRIVKGIGKGEFWAECLVLGLRLRLDSGR